MSQESIDTATGEIAPAERSTRRVKHIFSAIAPEYERFNRVSSLGIHRLWTRKLVQLTPIGPGDEVLDIAAGTGDVTFALSALHPAKIWCTDLVDAMLDQARLHYEHGKGHGVPITFEVVDAQAMPYEDNKFDAVTVAYGIRNMPERAKALKEVLRVLKPGGAFVCLEFSTPQNPLWARLYDCYRTKMVPFWGSLIAGKDQREDFVYLSSSIAAFPNQRDFADLLAEVGFRGISWTNCSGGIACVHRGFKPFNS